MWLYYGYSAVNLIRKMTQCCIFIYLLYIIETVKQFTYEGAMMVVIQNLCVVQYEMASKIIYVNDETSKRKTYARRFLYFLRYLFLQLQAVSIDLFVKKVFFNSRFENVLKLI